MSPRLLLVLTIAWAFAAHAAPANAQPAVSTAVLSADVRTLADESGLMNPVSRKVWKALRIDGRPARYRSEPAPAAA